MWTAISYLFAHAHIILNVNQCTHSKVHFLLRSIKELEIPLLLLWYTWGVRYWQKWYFDIFSIMIIKQYCWVCFCAVPWLKSVMDNKCEIKTASRWQQVPVSMSNSLNHSLKRFFKQLIRLQMKQVTVSMSNSLNHSLKRFFKTADSFTNEASDCVWINHWIIHSNDSFKTADSFTNEASDCLNEQFIESFTQTILQNSWFVYKWSKWLCLNKSLNHSLKRFLQNSWFVYKWSKWLSQWAIHWIIHSNDSSKQLIRLQMKQVTVFE